MSDDVALELSHITAGYGRATVLRDVDLVVPTGSIVALLGPNGAGKTTLLRVASGLLTPTEGTVAVAGNDMTRRRASQRARAGVCLIPEGRGVFPTMTVRDNLLVQVPPWGTATDFERAFEAFPTLRRYLDQPAGRLSGGEQQMVALSRAWIAQPSVILLDEVSMGLAPLVVDEIFVALRRLAGTGVTLLLVEQYVQRALDMADSAVLLDRGSVTFAGAASALDRDALLHGYLGARPDRPGPDRPDGVP